MLTDFDKLYNELQRDNITRRKIRRYVSRVIESHYVELEAKDGRIYIECNPCRGLDVIEYVYSKNGFEYTEHGYKSVPMELMERALQNAINILTIKEFTPSELLATRFPDDEVLAQRLKERPISGIIKNNSDMARIEELRYILCEEDRTSRLCSRLNEYFDGFITKIERQGDIVSDILKVKFIDNMGKALVRITIQENYLEVRAEQKDVFEKLNKVIDLYIYSKNTPSELALNWLVEEGVDVTIFEREMCLHTLGGIEYPIII